MKAHYFISGWDFCSEFEYNYANLGDRDFLVRKLCQVLQAIRIESERNILKKAF